MMTDWPSKSFKLIVKRRFAGEWGGEEGASEVNVPCIRVADFNRFKNIVSDDVPTVRSISKRTVEVKQLQHRDILIEKSGGGEKTPVGTPILYLGSENAICSNFIEVVRLQPGHDPRFWTYVLISSYEGGNTRRFINQTTGIQNIDSQRFYDQVFHVPPLETQQRIADYLDRETAEIDAAMADLDRYVDLLEKRRQVLIVEAVDSLLSVSLTKTVRNLETLGWLELGRGRIISKEDMENLPGDYPVYSSAFTNNGFFGKYGEYLFEDERISWSIDGGGMPFYRHKHKYSLTNVSGWMRVVDDSIIYAKYLYYAVLNAWYRNSFDYAFKAHPSVIRDLYSVPIPALRSQQKMADYLDRETAEIDGLIAESTKLRNLLLKRRSVLITDVVTGRKQV